MNTELKTLQDFLDLGAIEQGFADYAQIDMTELEEFERNEHKVIIYQHAAERYGKYCYEQGWNNACARVRSIESSSLLMHSFFVEGVNPDPLPPLPGTEK